MPAKGTSLLCGKRYNPLNKKLYKKYIEKTGRDISFKKFKEIIEKTNEKLRIGAAEEEIGVALPERMGYILVVKYKSNKWFVDWVNSNRLKKKVPFTNVHSLGYIYHIKWVKIGIVEFPNSSIYKFQPYRLLKRHVAKNVKEGKVYFKWDNSDFLSSTKLERKFIKMFKREKS